ncbi:hypothetical protein V9T40_010813 [Parthenolecanium corni]|uniref:Uncharacterized protein n=1 Tax=Parthenolecanium corni TaxID=536013 RepID=A0AAN9THF8_9HEMI
MEEQLSNLAEQMKAIQMHIKILKSQKPKDETNQQKDFIRPSANPATILTQEMNFDVWFKMLTGELASLKYDDLLLEPMNENGEPNYDPANKGRINFVATFILSRVDDSYKQSLCDLTVPLDMIKKIREIRFPNLMSMRMTLERRWTNMVMADSEDVLKFTNRFHDAN